MAHVLAQSTSLPQALREIAVEGLSQPSHLALFHELARHLVRIHARVSLDGSPRYRERLRAMIGGRGGVLELLDTLPLGRGSAYDAQRLSGLERKFLAWRWRLRERGERLRYVHQGLSLERVLVFEQGAVAVVDPVLDAGDPALDLSAVAADLLTMGVREPVCWEDGYKPLFDAFWSAYLAESGDFELLDVAPPFLAWRALAASASLPAAAQQKLVAFAEDVLTQPSFNPDETSRFVR